MCRGAKVKQTQMERLTTAGRDRTAARVGGGVAAVNVSVPPLPATSDKAVQSGSESECLHSNR